MASDILVIAETKLRTEDIDDNIELKDFDVVQRIKGMVMYKKMSMPPFDVQVTEASNHQIMSCDLPCGRVSFVYINPKIQAAERKELIQSIKSMPNFLALIGDLNIRRDLAMSSHHDLDQMCIELGEPWQRYNAT